MVLPTAYVCHDRILDALRSSVDGFAEKTNTWNDFVEAIDRIVRGEDYISRRTSDA